MRADEPRRAVIYARYSSHTQREESIEDQVRVCQEAADEAGDVVVAVYSDGRCECEPVRQLEANHKPDSEHVDGMAFDTWTDYFEDEGQAQDFAEGYELA